MLRVKLNWLRLNTAVICLRLKGGVKVGLRI